MRPIFQRPARAGRCLAEPTPGTAAADRSGRFHLYRPDLIADNVSGGLCRKRETEFFCAPIKMAKIVMSDIIPVTRTGYDKLRAELEELQSVQMPAIAKRIAEARSEGDLSENAEYHGARESQGMLQAKINLLSDKLARATIIDTSKLPRDEVVFGATVVVKDLDFGDKETFTMVGAGEEDYENGKIMVTSPLAQGLLGRKVGEKVEHRRAGRHGAVRDSRNPLRLARILQRSARVDCPPAWLRLAGARARGDLARAYPTRVEEGGQARRVGSTGGSPAIARSQSPFRPRRLTGSPIGQRSSIFAASSAGVMPRIRNRLVGRSRAAHELDLAAAQAQLAGQQRDDGLVGLPFLGHLGHGHAQRAGSLAAQATRSGCRAEP